MSSTNAAESSGNVAEDLARAYLVALQAKDKNAILSIITDDFVLEVPCNVSGTNDFSDSWRGIKAASAGWDSAFERIEVLQYRDLEFTGAEGGTVAFAEGRGVMRMANGRPYENRYVFRFDVEGGKLKRIREYANPVTAAVAFGMALPEVDVRQ
jgi:ketosteroid isomerase-like protein